MRNLTNDRSEFLLSCISRACRSAGRSISRDLINTHVSRNFCIAQHAFKRVTLRRLSCPCSINSIHISICALLFASIRFYLYTSLHWPNARLFRRFYFFPRLFIFFILPFSLIAFVAYANNVCHQTILLFEKAHNIKLESLKSFMPLLP